MPDFDGTFYKVNYPRCMNLREVYVNVHGQCMPCCDLAQGIKTEAWKTFFKKEWNLNYFDIDSILKSIEIFVQEVDKTKTSPIEKCSKTCINRWTNQQTYFHIEPSTRCTLACPKCPRTRWPIESPDDVFEKKDMKFEHFESVVNALPKGHSMLLQGGLGDPVFHPRIFEMINLMDSKNIEFRLTTASPARTLKWWQELYNNYNNKNSIIQFSVDGLHDTAHIYRKGQDFNKIWEAMVYGAKLGKKIVWSFIPFSHNEHQIRRAMQMANDNGIIIKIAPSNRWNGPNDPLRPKNPILYAKHDRGY